MTILFVHTYYYPEIHGGAEISVLKLAEELVKKGHRCCVYCTSNCDSDEIINGVEIYRRKSMVRSNADMLGVFKRPAHFLGEVSSPKVKSQISSIIDTCKPDIVHTNCLYYLSSNVWKVSHRRGIPIVQTIRDYFFSCFRGFSTTDRERCAQCMVPSFACNVFKRRYRNVSKTVSVVTAPSSFTLGNMIDQGLFSSSESVVIPNAIDFEEASVLDCIQAHKHRDRETFNFAFLGTLSEKKGIKWLLRSFQDLSDQKVRLFIAGKGELEDLVRKAASTDERISFKGFLAEEGISELLRMCDALIVPSIWDEPFGRVVLDGFKNGVPVLASRSGGLPEIVSDGVNGFLVSPNSKNDLISAMNRIQNPEVYRLLCDGIYPTISRYSIGEQANRFVRLYEAYAGLAGKL
ncbi:glycosyltransferase family 4 protein [Thermophilibacter sp.]